MQRLLLLLLFIASPSFAWVSGDNLTVKSIMTWGTGVASIELLNFQLSNDVWCYVPPEQKALQSIILATFLSGKKLEIYCFDGEDEVAGTSVAKSHKLHRITIKQ